jgi:hypothetical protein
LSEVDKHIPDVVGLDVGASLRILAESGVEAKIIQMKDWRRTEEIKGDCPFRVVCQRAVGHWGVTLLVAPDLYRRTCG